MSDSALNIQLKRLIRAHMNFLSLEKKKEGAVLNAVATIIDQTIDINTKESLNCSDFQLYAASLNEKTSNRKSKGVFYTDDDVVEYIIGNTYLNYIHDDVQNVFPIDVCVREMLCSEEKDVDKLLKASVFDPTCGTGQFLLPALKIKISLLDKGIKDDKSTLNLLKTIHGNDIDSLSIKIAMVRLFFWVLPLLSEVNSYQKAASILKANFLCIDYVMPITNKKIYNIIIGNPPYVEYGKLEVVPPKRLGNAYANVVFNSLEQLSKDGVMGYIIPLSFVSTPRMSDLRKEIIGRSKKMIVVNFADRPDCLFTQVHQKLTILIAVKGRSICKTYSSNYYYWYKSERTKLFNECAVYPTKYEFEGFIPKIGNPVEESIFGKILKRQEDVDFLKLQVIGKGNADVCLNMRGTFWMKAFDINPGSKEYNTYSFSKEMQPYIICLLNSSLFFFFWIVVSDCWHITGKELGNIRIRTDVDLGPFKRLSEKLLNKLEETKKYIGTVQCDFEYKHKFCKKEIDAIDDQLAQAYCLTPVELDYIKGYQLKYRMNDGEE